MSVKINNIAAEQKIIHMLNNTQGSSAKETNLFCSFLASDVATKLFLEDFFFCVEWLLGSSRLSLCSSTSEWRSSSQVISQIVNFWWNIIVSTRIRYFLCCYSYPNLISVSCLPRFIYTNIVHIWSKCGGTKKRRVWSQGNFIYAKWCRACCSFGMLDQKILEFWILKIPGITRTTSAEILWLSTSQ